MVKKYCNKHGILRELDYDGYCRDCGKFIEKGILEIKQKYNTIIIDPPWNLKLTGGFNLRENRATELPYKTMSLEEIKSFPIKDFANNGCHIYLWTTNSFLKDAFDVLESWGVHFHLVLVYCKPSFIAPVLAYQFATEFCLLGFYGKPMQKFLGKVKLNWLKAIPERGNHSKKPIEFYNLIKEMSPAPRIDIFSRSVIAGFDAWGDEAPKEKQEELSSIPPITEVKGILEVFL